MAEDEDPEVAAVLAKLAGQDAAASGDLVPGRRGWRARQPPGQTPRSACTGGCPAPSTSAVSTTPNRYCSPNSRLSSE
jgi:hypothetical protein